jgi:hypothetical protein
MKPLTSVKRRRSKKVPLRARHFTVEPELVIELYVGSLSSCRRLVGRARVIACSSVPDVLVTMLSAGPAVEQVMTGPGGA